MRQHPAVFTITFDGMDGTIDAFVINEDFARDLLIKGTFNTDGVITGNVHLSTFDNDLKTDIASPNGTLSGLIGQQGAVGVFHGDTYSGGFLAGPKCGRRA